MTSLTLTQWTEGGTHAKLAGKRCQSICSLTFSSILFRKFTFVRSTRLKSRTASEEKLSSQLTIVVELQLKIPEAAAAVLNGRNANNIFFLPYHHLVTGWTNQTRALLFQNTHTQKLLETKTLVTANFLVTLQRRFIFTV